MGESVHFWSVLLGAVVAAGGGFAAIWIQAKLTRRIRMDERIAERKVEVNAQAYYKIKIIDSMLVQATTEDVLKQIQKDEQWFFENRLFLPGKFPDKWLSIRAGLQRAILLQHNLPITANELTRLDTDLRNLAEEAIQEIYREMGLSRLEAKMPRGAETQQTPPDGGNCPTTSAVTSVCNILCWPVKFFRDEVVGWWRWFRRAKEENKIQAFIFTVQAFTLIVLAFTAFFSYRAASLQQKSSDLETRPYLSLRIANLSWNTTPTDTFIGPDVVYSNLGKVPASNIQTKFYITTDKDGGNHALEEYAKENWGGYPAVTFLAPGQTEAISRRLSLSPSTEVYYFHAVATYEGIEKDKQYWTELRKAFRITNRLFIEIDSFGNWDRTDEVAVPEVHPPNMADYLPKKPDTKQAQ